MMTLPERLELLDQLSHKLQQADCFPDSIVQQATAQNVWFSKANITHSIQSIATNYLPKEKIKTWLAPYPMKDPAERKTIGLVAAGNIPLVVFHDVLVCFVAGHIAQIKLSQKDSVLLPYILELAHNINPESDSYFQLVERLSGFDAVIATGSDNSSRYFEYYFGAYPHIIRKNRVGIAILHGGETDESLLALGKDVFQYFGLGCRNVSCLWVPAGYDMSKLILLWNQFSAVKENHAYNNNYDYNFALFIMNQTTHLVGETLLYKESDELVSRIASIHYRYYTELSEINTFYHAQKESIQVMISDQPIHGIKTIVPGTGQCPTLNQYADEVDTLKFLLQL